MIKTAILLVAAAQAGAVAPTIQVIALAPPLPAGAIRGPATAAEAGEWGRAADYPAAALAARREGRVTLMVAVQPDDSVSGCTIVQSEALSTTEQSYRMRGEPAGSDLEQAACGIATRRGAYRHALGADGAALPGGVPLIVNFLLSDPRGAQYFSPAPMSPPPFSAAATPQSPDALTLAGVGAAHFPQRQPVASVSISERGRPLSCLIATSSGTDAGDVAVCRHLMRLAYTPARDRSGERVASPRTILRLSASPR